MERNQIASFSKTVASNCTDCDNGDTITNSYDIANTFNNYLASIAETTKKNIHINTRLHYTHNLRISVIIQYNVSATY